MSNETYNSYLDAEGLALVLSGIRDKINAAAEGITNTKGKANGIASLDAGGNVPLSQLGNLDTTFFEVVTELPTDIRNIKKHIYILKGNKDGDNNKYAEYIYTGDLTDAGDLAGDVDATKWEKLGDFVPTFDLQEYVKKNGAVAKLKFYDPVLDDAWNGDDDQPSETAIRIEFADGSHQYLVVPKATAPINASRSNSELSDSEKSKPFQYPGSAGFMSPSDKGKLDKIDLNALTASINAANTAADNTNKAIQAAETATTGAETCNVELSGSTISVTNRNGETKSVDVINTDEEVTVTIASSVDSIKVSGIKINVFLNNGKTPQTYTTDAEGKATFTIARGNYYQVVFPEYGNAQPIAPVGYTAVLGSRNINVEYLPYDEDSMEKVIITATKYVENVGTAWEGIPVVVTVDKKDTTYQTDEKGQVTVFVPYKKEYTVVINDQDGYNVSFNKNSRTYTANVPQRLIDYRFYQFKAGIFVVDANKNEYYIEDWVAAGRNADDAVAIKVADASLSINHGTFCIRTSDIKNVSKLISAFWCTQKLQFNSIALNGNNVKDANYYNGESSSYLIRQEAQERSLSVPAFDYAYGQIFNLGGEDLHGFVMSVGQEYVHVANIGIIKQVLETLYGETVATDYYNFVMKKYRWTSTQFNAMYAWFFSSSASNVYVKPSSFVVLPVFAC
nr:hypothetical protein [uncultured Prevotella sp.]